MITALAILALLVLVPLEDVEALSFFRAPG